MLKQLDQWRERVENWPWTGILLSALFISMMFAADGVIFPVPTHPHQTHYADGTQKPAKKSAIATPDERASDRIADYTWWLTFFTAVLGAASIAQFWFLIRADNATRESIDDAKISSERQLRAYINLKEGSTDNNQATITVENFGETPAYGLSFWADAIHTEPGAMPAFAAPAGQVPGSPTVVGPGQRFHIKPNVRDGRLPTTNLITQPVGEIYVFGEITYEDAFKKLRTTRFCLAGKYPRGPFATVGPNNTAT